MILKPVFVQTMYRVFPRILGPHAFVLADYSGTFLSQSTLNVVVAARKFADKVTVGVFAPARSVAQLAAQAAALPGVSGVVHMGDDVRFEHLVADTLASAIVAVATDVRATHILGSSSTTAKDVLPRVGALVDSQPISDVVEVVTADTFKRSMYAGNVIATVQSVDSNLKILNVRPTSFPSSDSSISSSPAAIISSQTNLPPASASLITVEREEAKDSNSNRVDLATASVVVAGGRGLKSQENFEKILAPLCAKLKAGLGASRAAVDAGFAPNELQIGQTGKVVAPALYIAVGISGAIQHLAGMKDSRTIVAINKDGDAPIFQVADFGLVGDLNLIVPDLVSKL